MEQRRLFEVPFYGLSPEEYRSERERSAARPPPYPYNQVVGWLRVERHGERIKAYAFRQPVRRLGRLQGWRRQPYEWTGPHNEFDLWVATQSPQEIAAAIRSSIVALTQPDGPFPGCQADLEAFDNLAPHVDWRGVLGLDDMDGGL